MTEDEKSLGDFLTALTMTRDPAVSARGLQRLATYDALPSQHRGLTLGGGAGGGFLLPTGYVSQVLGLSERTAIVRPRALTLPMDRLELNVPTLDTATAPVTGAIVGFGGVSPKWVGPDADAPESQPGFQQTKLVAHRLSAYFKCGRTLLQNSPALAAGLLESLLSGAVSAVEDRSFLVGLGVGEPLGVINSPATITTSARASATTISHSDLTKMEAALLPSSIGKAVYIISQNAWAAVLDSEAEVGSIFGRVHFHYDRDTGRQRLFLNNHELLISPCLPDLNDPGDIILADLTKYLVGDLLTVEINASEHYLFRDALVAFRLEHMVAGLPLFSSPITLDDGESEVSPFVQLGPASV